MQAQHNQEASTQPHNPIEHVVIIVKENHTFDNYFGTFPDVNGVSDLTHASDPPAGDPRHDHVAWLNRAAGAVRQQYHEADIPAYFAYARQFTLCDNFYSEIASQSEPNHLMLIAADSPIIDNSSAHRTYQPQEPFDLPSLPGSLARAGLTWKTYGDPKFSYFNHITELAGSPNIVSWSQFDAEAASGNLPSVSWVYAPSPYSEHPPTGKNPKPTVGPGMQWTAKRVNQFVKSKLWENTVVFITWDDWGGWYDHVEPPLKETWKGGGPTGTNYTGTQFSYGSRIGCIVLSPFAKQGYISREFHSHVSIVKFCETTFGLSPLNARDAASDDMSDCFDFNQTPLPAPKVVHALRTKAKHKPRHTLRATLEPKPKQKIKRSKK